MYVAITSFNPLKIYWYKKGLVWFASETYSTDEDEINNIKIHLTNSSKYTGDILQKKWEITELLDHMS